MLDEGNWIRQALGWWARFNKKINGAMAFCISIGALAVVWYDSLLFAADHLKPEYVRPTDLKIGILAFLIAVFPAWLWFSSDKFIRKRLRFVKELEERGLLDAESASRIRRQIADYYKNTNFPLNDH